MALTIKTTVEPAIEPVTVAEVKRWQRITWDDDDDDLAALISAARLWLERRCNRALITRTLVMVDELPIARAAHGPVGGLVGYPPRLAWDLPYPPLATVTQVELEQDIEQWHTLIQDNPPSVAGDYRVDADNEPGRVWLHSSALALWMPSWDWTGARTPRIRITYTAGYGATAASVPFPLRQALRSAVSWLYENRESGGEPPDSLLPSTGITWTL